MDLQKLNDSVDIVEVAQRATNQTLKREGNEMVGLCPFHSEKTPSFKVNKKKQIFKCFGCGKAGNALKLLKLLFEGKGQSEKDSWKSAIEWIQNAKGAISAPVKAKAVAKSKPWVVQPFGPATSSIVHYKHGKPSGVWAYHTTEGKIIGYVCRFDLKDHKEVLPYSYCSNGTDKRWQWRGFLKPRPIYNMHLLAKYPKKNVLVVEGEKTADAAQKLFPHIVAITWPGGTNAVEMADWSILKGRNVLLWPDNDTEQKYGDSHEKSGQIKPWNEQPGNQAMLLIASILKHDAALLRWIKNGPDFPHKWDVADAKWTPEEARRYAKDNLIEIPTSDPSPRPIPKKEKPPEKRELTAKPGASAVPEKYVASRASDGDVGPPNAPYFSFLGYEKQDGSVLYCFYVKESRTVHKYTAPSLGRLSIFVSLAPLDFWKSWFTEGKSRIKPEMALDWLVRASHAKGFFSQDNLRGRGAWLDKGRVVFHAGDHLVVDNKRVPLGDLDSKYIYEAGPALGYDISSPLKTTEANKLLLLTKDMNWSRGINAYLLAGWCVIAPVCGALIWRPHIWITGGAGTGKSWTLKEMVRPLLGLSAFVVQSETTEPGLRQTIRSDALPVVFDEADAEDMQQQYQIKKVIGLMRSASADDGGAIVKGSSGGNANKYRIRSCFAFASIGLSATQQSDRTRITVLSLINLPDGPEKEAKWEALQQQHAETITDEFTLNLQARTLQLLPVILQNAKTFAKAAATLLGKQRIGDQVGYLLAGAYSLTSTKVISYPDAFAWIKDKNWNEERELEETRDENRLLNHLMERIVRVDRSSASTVERTIGELIGIASLEQDDEAVTESVADRRLTQHGIKVYQDESGAWLFAVSNSSGHIKRFLHRTPWLSNWSTILARLDNAQKKSTMRFATGHSSRAVAIPIENLQVVQPKKEPLKPDDELPF